MPSPVRLKDIAARLGLDKSTVSLALRDHPRIPEETRRRIKETAQAMGYQPDPALRRLATMRWGGSTGQKPFSMALLSYSRKDYPMQRDHLLPHLKSTAESLGYGFEVLFLEDYPRPAAATQVLRARGVRGLLVMSSREVGNLQSFPWQEFSAVQLLSSYQNLPLMPAVRHDATGIVLDAGRRVMEAGCRSAMQIYIGSDSASVTDLRYQAAALLVRKWWEDAGIEDHGILRQQAGVEGARGMVENIVLRRPEAVIVQNGSMVWALRERGIRLPEDLKLINLTQTDADESGLAGYHRSFDLMAASAVQVLDGFLRTDTRTALELPQVTVISDRWVPGASFPEMKNLPMQKKQIAGGATGNDETSSS